MDDARTLSCPDNSDALITPGRSPGVSRSEPSFGANNLRGLRSAPRKRVGGSVFFSGTLMPTRLLREGILTSERVNQLSIQAELFYRRLMSVVDDYGRFFAHPALLRASCYPLKLNQTKEHHISKWLGELSDAGLISVYETGSTKYLEMQDFRQRQRYDSKYPDQKTVLKTVLKTVQQIATPSCDTPTPTPTPVVKEKGGNGGKENGFDRFWASCPRKIGKAAAEKAWCKLAPDDALQQTLLEAVRTQARWPQWVKDGGQFIPHPATWLNGKRWLDEAPAEAAFPHDERPTRRSVADDLTPDQRARLKELTAGIAKHA